MLQMRASDTLSYPWMMGFRVPTMFLADSMLNNGSFLNTVKSFSNDFYVSLNGFFGFYIMNKFLKNPWFIFIITLNLSYRW